MVSFLLEERSLLLLLQRQGKGQRKCATDLGVDHPDMEVRDHLIIDILDLGQYLVLGPLATPLVPEAASGQDPVLLPQGGEVIIPFPREGRKTSTQGHREIFLKSEMGLGLILQVMPMVMVIIKLPMDMMKDQCTSLMKHELGGGHPLDEPQGRLLVLDLVC